MRECPSRALRRTPSASASPEPKVTELLTEGARSSARTTRPGASSRGMHFRPVARRPAEIPDRRPLRCGARTLWEALPGRFQHRSQCRPGISSTSGRESRSISAAQSDLFLPQALNLDRVDGLSFDKGCYAGQEIIARTQYLGRLKRHLRRAALHAAEPPIPGDAVHFRCRRPRRDRQDRWSTSPHRSTLAEWELLAVINDAAVTAELRLGNSLGPALDLLPLSCDAEPHAA